MKSVHAGFALRACGAAMLRGMNRNDWRALACGRTLFHLALRLMLARRLQRLDRRRFTS